MVDGSIDSQQSDQDDGNDEYPPDETETKRIEEVSEDIRNHGSVAYSHPFLPCVNALLPDSSQMGDGGTRTKEGSPGVRVFL